MSTSGLNAGLENEDTIKNTDLNENIRMIYIISETEKSTANTV